ncbi:MAG: hypothetical protein AAF789_01830 [Bacteroidota bacterium]
MRNIFDRYKKKFGVNCKVCLFLLIANGALITSTSGQEVWSDKTRVLPNKLRKVRTILTLSHLPNPDHPEEAEEESKWKYIWKHSTTICSPYEDLEVIEAGSFIWYTSDGWKENVQLSRREFIKRFECPKGLLKKGHCYTYEKNYRFGNTLYGGDALWYVLAKDANGELVKGFGIIETEKELKDDKF